MRSVQTQTFALLRTAFYFTRLEFSSTHSYFATSKMSPSCGTSTSLSNLSSTAAKAEEVLTTN
jgi:hypothetical protein